jgi:hypothetical protein
MHYASQRGLSSGRPYDLDHNLVVQFNCKQSTVEPRETLPVRTRPDVGFKDATPASTPSTSSTTSISPDRDDRFEISSASSYDSDTIPPEPYHNPRRTSVGAAPPPLQRCDYKHRTFVEGLLAVTTSFVESIWPLSRETPRSSTEFNGAGVLSLRTFIQETCRRSKTSYSTLQIALYYLILLKGVLPDLDFTREQPRGSDRPDMWPTDSQVLLGQSNEPSACRVMQCGRRMFMAALMLAAKYLQDRNFSCRAWARISGLSCTEINQNERAYLQSIEYRLHITKENFDNWSQIVNEFCQSEKVQGSLDYPKIIRRLRPGIIHDSVNTKHFLKEIREGRYHPGCSNQFGSSSHNSITPGHQPRQIPLNSEFMQTPFMPAPVQSVRPARLSCAQTRAIPPGPKALTASIHTCPPPRPAHIRPSVDIGSRLLQASLATNAAQTASNAVLHFLQGGVDVDCQLRSNDRAAGVHCGSYRTQTLQSDPALGVSTNLEALTACLNETSPSSPRSTPSSPDSVTESAYTDGAETVSRTRSSSISSAPSLSSQDNLQYQKKVVPDLSLLHRLDLASADDADSGYGSQNESQAGSRDKSYTASHAESHAEIVVPEKPSRNNLYASNHEFVIGCAKRKALPAPTVSESTAAATLLLLSKSSVELEIISEAENKKLTVRRAFKKRGQSKSLKPGHTSEHTKAKRQKERANSRMDKTQISVFDPALSEPTWSSDATAEASEQDFGAEKESQVGHKSWADTRKPVPTQDNPRKRRAQYAPSLAASMLWKDASRAMVGVSR